MFKFYLFHLPNYILRKITNDKYYICEECNKIHKHVKSDIEMKDITGIKLRYNRYWYGFIKRKCFMDTGKPYIDYIKEKMKEG